MAKKSTHVVFVKKWMILMMIMMVMIAISLAAIYVGQSRIVFMVLAVCALMVMCISIIQLYKSFPYVLIHLNNFYKRTDKLLSLMENINQNMSFDDVLKFIYDSFSPFVPYTYIGIALIDDDGETLEAAYGISDGIVKDLPQKLMGMRVNMHETSLGKIIQKGKPRIINDLEEYARKHRTKDYTYIILNAGIKASITLPLKVNNKPVGFIFFSSIHKNVYTMEHTRFLETLAGSIAISFEQNIFVDELLYSSIIALAKLAEARDEDTGQHLERMKNYSKLLAMCLYEDSLYKEQLSPDYIKGIEHFSPMHDIGKVGISDRILQKQGKLTAEEFEEMKGHAVYGANVLRTAEENIEKRGKKLFSLGIEIAEGHHERWDGSGYPYGRKGTEIPLSARIVAVADVFDALTSRRPYKEPFPFNESFNMIVSESGTHFDPEIVRCFVKNKYKIYQEYQRYHMEKYNKDLIVI